MKFTNLGHRTVSVVVLIAFIALLQGGPTPAQTTPGDSTTATVTHDGDATGSVEAEAEAPAVVKKHKKFPWLVATLGAVAVGVAVYLLIHKKTSYTLRVTLSPWTSGTPSAKASFKKGRSVSYNYSAQYGHGDVKVTLDGVEKPAWGTIIMDRDHDILVYTVHRATLHVNSTPAGAKIYIDNADSGFVTPHTFLYPDSTTKTVLLRACGYKDWEREVDLPIDHQLWIEEKLEPGIKEEFIIPISPCWLARDPANLTQTGSWITATAPERGYQYILYQYPFQSYYVFSTEIRTASVIASKSDYRVGVILSTTSDMANSRGYEIIFTRDRQYAIYKNDGYDYLTDSGNRSYIKPPTICGPRNTSPGAWNNLEIENVGGTLYLQVNHEMVFSFTNKDYDVRHVALAIFGKGAKADFLRVNLSGAGN